MVLVVRWLVEVVVVAMMKMEMACCDVSVALIVYVVLMSLCSEVVVQLLVSFRVLVAVVVPERLLH